MAKGCIVGWLPGDRVSLPEKKARAAYPTNTAEVHAISFQGKEMRVGFPPPEAGWACSGGQSVTACKNRESAPAIDGASLGFQIVLGEAPLARRWQAAVACAGLVKPN